MPYKDRQRGAIIGLAVGDALGAAVEFSQPGEFEPVTGLLHGRPREEVLSPDWPPLEQITQNYVLHTEIDEVRQGSFRYKQPPKICGGGYVVQSLEAALWAFHDANDFREAVLRAVNLGHDADTTAAVCGQLAGAYWGESGIPQAWRDGLASRAMIEPILERLLFGKT